MAKKTNLSDDDQAYAEAEKALPMGSGVQRSGKGLAAPVQLSPDQDRQAELLGKQDAARELERRGLTPPPIVETNLSANFAHIKRPGDEVMAMQTVIPVPVAAVEAPSQAVQPISLEERATIRTAGYDPRTGQIVDPERYARWRAHNAPPADHASPEVRSESGWWELRPKLPKPLPSPVMKLEAADLEDAKRQYCRLFGMSYPNPGVEWDIKPCAAPALVSV